MLTVQAPAKINLTLEVLAKRRDGYHEVRSIIQTVNLCDSLHFQPSRNIEFESSAPDWVPEKSLTSRAASLLKEATAFSGGAKLEVDKRIPLMSGLGGDSSDAAAVLRGLNELWKLGLPPDKLYGLAVRLGSDVPFFLYGGTALARGRGEILSPLPPLPHMWVVLVVPSVSRALGKTERLYASLKASHYTNGQITENLAKNLREGKEITSFLLFNTFENIAFVRTSEISIYRSHILKVGAADIHLAGSGPALFTLVKDKTQAEDLHLHLQQQRMESYLTETLE